VAIHTSFRRLLRDGRIEMTLYQLKASRLSADEIAELSGFSCASSMRRAIKSACGLPLSKAREPTLGNLALQSPSA
jgi:AraC-like DNA-binding protein